jgi:hypothetical protein
VRYRNNLTRLELLTLWDKISLSLRIKGVDKDILYDVLDDWFNER